LYKIKSSTIALIFYKEWEKAASWDKSCKKGTIKNYTTMNKRCCTITRLV